MKVPDRAAAGYIGDLYWQVVAMVELSGIIIVESH